MKKFLFFQLFILLSCKKELDISEFAFNYSNYSPELRIEALILPHDSTAIVRIDKSYMISDTDLYDCRDNDHGFITLDSCLKIEDAFWHGNEGELLGDCGDWNPLIHDIGEDGVLRDPNDEDKDRIIEEDSKGENNGIPDCGEPNVDSYAEILPNIHNKTCNVLITMTLDGISDSCNLIYKEDAGQFFNNKYSGDRSSPIFNNIEIVNYGAYVPALDCRKEFFTEYSAEYAFLADCSESEFPTIIRSKSPIRLPRPVVFFLPEDSLKIIKCKDYKCLQLESSISDYTSDSLLYFGRYSFGTKVNYASILPAVSYQAVQYMYNNENNNYVYYHGHPAAGTDMLNIIDSVTVMIETVVSEFYDGQGNGIWDDAEKRVDDSNECGENDVFSIDKYGGFCDNGNGIWDSEEIYADENQDGEWNEGEYFIDTADDLPDVNKYYYEIFTFSDSYNRYYFNDQLFLDDLERTNLRDLNNNAVLGAFGSMASKKIYFEIIDCTVNGFSDCEKEEITHSVCKWNENISLRPCADYEGSICLPKDFTTEYCE